MTARSWILALGLTLLAWMPGCIILTTPTNPAAYARCTSSCEAGSTCQVSTLATSGESFCSSSCVASSDCPASPDGTAVSCVTVTTTSGPVNQCYRTCSSSNPCPSGSTCISEGGMTPVCVPGSGTATCGGSGQACCSGNTCNSGLTCGVSSSGAQVCGVAASCGASGQACCTGSTCNSGLVCGTSSSGAVVCGVPAPTCGASGQGCCAGNTCDAGLTCGIASNGAMVCGVAAACGDIGQACCTGNTCTAAGAACGSDGHCGLAPYSGCGGSSIGAACLGGQDSTGGVVATTCQQTMIANPGPNGFCTALCAASAAECPQWVGATRTYTYNCYILQGTTQGQCFIDCPNGEGCPANTICSMTANSLGAQVRLCMPMPG